MQISVPSIILPAVHPLSTETEDINNLVVHTSLEFPVPTLREKQIQVVAVEVVVAGVPGALWCWVELSPYPTAYSNYWVRPLPISAAYWAAIGGGGGALLAGLPVLPPTAPLIEAATGVNLVTHTFMLAWTINASWARVRFQTPVAATPATAFWSIQVMFSGQG